jgi:membrane protein DedA with SNARE-associated domain
MGAVTAVLLGLDATAPSTHGPMLAPIWLCGAFIGACCGYALGALIGWELSADPLRGAGLRGERRLLPRVAEVPLTEADMP